MAEEGEIPTKPKYPGILVIDDEKGIRDLIKVFINMNGYKCDTVGSLEDAKVLIENTRYDIVFLDLILNDGSGMCFIDEILSKNPDTIIVIISGIPECENLKDAIQNGAFDYIEKPFNLIAFQEKLNSLIKEWEVRALVKKYKELLSSMFNEHFGECKNINRSDENIFNVATNFIDSLSLPFPETDSHRRRLTKLCELFGNNLGLTKNTLEVLRYGAYLHDIGMKLIACEIVEKPGVLNEEEFKEIKRHPIIGFSIIEGQPFLIDIGNLIIHHHEWYNGDGYPLGLQGKNIPISARIFSIVDAFDAMMIGRPYKKSIIYEDAIRELIKNKGKQFDPELVDSFSNIPYQEINLVYTDKLMEEGKNGSTIQCNG